MRKLYERAFAHPVFTIREAEALIPEWKPSAVHTKLRELIKHDRLGRVVAGLYFVVSPGQRSETAPVDPYLVGSRLAPDALLAYHTALELLGTAYSAMNVVYYVSPKYRRPLVWREVTYRHVTPPRNLTRSNALRVGVSRQERTGLEVLHTNRARTLVDCLDRLDLAGGIEELLKSAEAWSTIEVHEVLQYLELLKKATLYAKLGYVLELLAGKWGLSGSDIELFRARVPRGAVYLDKRSKRGRHVARWNLLVPANLEIATQAV